MDRAWVSQKADVYSFGVLLVFLFVGELQWPGVFLPANKVERGKMLRRLAVEGVAPCVPPDFEVSGVPCSRGLSLCARRLFSTMCVCARWGYSPRVGGCSSCLTGMYPPPPPPSLPPLPHRFPVLYHAHGLFVVRSRRGWRLWCGCAPRFSLGTAPPSRTFSRTWTPPRALPGHPQWGWRRGRGRVVFTTTTKTTACSDP
jgi:hypothetical protein